MMRVLLALVSLATALLGAGAQGPHAPVVTGPRQATSGTVTYRFSSTEAGIPAAKLHFLCAVDNQQLHACPASLRVFLKPGKHVLTVVAVDPAGRRSSATKITIAVVPPPAVQPLQAKQVWQVAIDGAPQAPNYGNDVETDAAGNVYVTDEAQGRIDVYDPNGALLHQWGSTGSGPGQFQFQAAIDLTPGEALGGIGIDQKAGFAYIADPGNTRIEKFDLSGRFLQQWGTSGTGNGQFTRPIAVAVDPNGAVYVLDDRPLHLGRVSVFDASGTFVRTFGSRQITDAGGLDVDPAGNIVVADDEDNSLRVFTPRGTLLRTIAPSIPQSLSFPVAPAIDAQGRIYVADQKNERIAVVDEAAGKIVSYLNLGATPTGLCLDGHGNLFVATDTGLVTKYRLP